MIYTLQALIGSEDTQTQDGRGFWVRAIPLPFYSDYLRAAWAVLTGKAVAVRYPIAGELEQALYVTGGMSIPAPRRKAGA